MRLRKGLKTKQSVRTRKRPGTKAASAPIRRTTPLSTSPTPTTRPTSSIELDPRGSKLSGFAGHFETAMREYKIAVHALTLLPLFALASVVLGSALLPAALAIRWAWLWAEHWPLAAQAPWLSFWVAASFYIAGLSLLVIAPVVNVALGLRLRPWRGAYYSWPAVKWYMHNGLTYLARYTILEFVTPTPFNILFYKWMGMKVGHGTLINSTHISDPCLIELGNRVTIGGSATILAHYGVGGLLVISPVKIGSNATIGLKATIMGGVEIGDGAKIMPHSVVLPRTKVPAGETWGGVPARKIDIARNS